MSSAASSTGDSDVQLAEHQLAAVERARELLDRRRAVLLADAPGLGKSYVAAELARLHHGPVEFIVPAGLVTQWMATLEETRVAATIKTHDTLHATWPPESERLIVVDEAHAFRNPATRRYDALARRVVGARVVLVTATPVCNSARDLLALLQLVAPDDLLADAGVPSIDVAFESADRASIDIILSEIMIRRDRDVVPAELQFGALTRHVIRHRVPELPLDALQFPLVFAAPLLRRFLRRRLESSEAAFIESIRRQRRFYERVLEAGRPMSKSDYRRAFAHEEDRREFQQVLFWDLWSPPAEVDRGAIGREMSVLAELEHAAAAARPEKRLALVELLARAREPALVFTGSASTARDIGAALGCAVATSRDGRAAIEAFRRHRLDVLVATDLASEGLNLQRAGIVVHYDIPWNPVKLDQRNGRAHRIGQMRDRVEAYYFLPEEDESGVVATVAAKNRVRRRIVRADGVAPRTMFATTLRPRLVRDATAARLVRALDDRDLPPALERRNRAGVDRMLEDVLREPDAGRRLERLLAITAVER